jgi:hypothetical protein
VLSIPSSDPQSNNAIMHKHLINLIALSEKFPSELPPDLGVLLFHDGPWSAITATREELSIANGEIPTQADANQAGEAVSKALQKLRTSRK